MSAKDYNQRPGILASPRLGLVYGLILAAIGILLFILLAFSVVRADPLTAADTRQINAIHQFALQSPAWRVSLMWVVAAFGQWVIIGASLLFGLYWLWHKQWRPLVMLIIGVAGGSLWFLFLAKLINRHRPVLSQPLSSVPYPGFPSGHMISTLTFYTLLLYLYLPRVRSKLARAVMILAYLLVLAAVSYSRLFIGDHYLTDVVAGIAVGVAWSAIVYPAVDWYLARRSPR